MKKLNLLTRATLAAVALMLGMAACSDESKTLVSSEEPPTTVIEFQRFIAEIQALGGAAEIITDSNDRLVAVPLPSFFDQIRRAGTDVKIMQSGLVLALAADPEPLCSIDIDEDDPDVIDAFDRCVHEVFENNKCKDGVRGEWNPSDDPGRIHVHCIEAH